MIQSDCLCVALYQPETAIMQADIEKPDCILFDNDIALNFTLTALSTLREKDDFKVDAYQTVSIDNRE